jgi:VIT1/CCC1 family predicted Fe2+/Mn2+ transporter
MRNVELHFSQRIGWLRAAVLGADDGIVSTASLILGVAAAGAPTHGILVAGVAGLAAGSMSMAAGEYVSVSSQSDTENADLEREKRELKENSASEHKELAQIYEKRGLDPALAKQVAQQLMAHDALGAHARDELGITEIHRARPVQAALASAASFAVGAVLPLIMVLVAPRGLLTWFVVALSLVCLSTLGAIASRAGGAKAWLGAVRVTFWGALAMAITYGVGVLFKVTV